MIPSYELTRLDPHGFEHLVNALGLHVLGAGLTGFAPGSDGGRDGFFEGQAPYPSSSEQWSGRWYIQSKFHAPHLSTDPQKWLLGQVKSEIEEFSRRDSRRTLPDNWIIATNIDQTGVPETGSFDAARAMVLKMSSSLANRFHIWGGRKILDLLNMYPNVASYYADFLTPGHVITRLWEGMNDASASIDDIVRYLTVTQFIDQQYTKLEQAGSAMDNRPGIQRLFTDLPFRCRGGRDGAMAAETLVKTLAQIHRLPPIASNEDVWVQWRTAPERARVWFVKGGPGQGKSTLTQYISQIQRAALIISSCDLHVTPAQRSIAEEIKCIASCQGLWPEVPRITISIELKDFAFWFGEKKENSARRILLYLAERFSIELGVPVLPGTLARAFSLSRWFFVFDGLDEVPGDVKDSVANEVIHFIDDNLVGRRSDSVIVCTSRPQGYSGQFSNMESAVIDLLPLSPNQALNCAKPVLEINRSPSESRVFMDILRQALQSPAVAEIMKTPLQSHIMAVIVRDGGRPPERRWQLFNTFYEVIKKREANRDLPDRELAKLLREGDKLLRVLHNRLGFELHARAETSKGATATIDRKDLKAIVTDVVKNLQDKHIGRTISTLMRATTERLVLVNTPENGDHVRFDIRPLQEFFAAEHIYLNGDPSKLEKRLSIVCGDSHWREVMHFLFSALVENGRTGDLSVAINVLRQIDSGNLSGIRTFNRRMARGGIIAGRLLSEGVLEQDKNIRAFFYDIIDTLAGQTSPNPRLTKKLQRHSTAWIQDVFMTALRKFALPETIGGINQLAILLPDSDKRVPEVVEFLKQTPLTYRAHFIRTFVEASNFNRIFVEASNSSNRSAPKWVVATAIGLLEDELWHTLPKTGVRAAMELVSQHRRMLVVPAQSPEVGKVLDAAFQYSAAFEAGNNLTTLYGGLTVQVNPRPKILDVKRWAATTWDEFARARGYFQSIFRVFRLLMTKEQKELDLLRLSLGGRLANAAQLPTAVTAFLRENLASLDDTSNVHSPEDVIEIHYPGCMKMYFSNIGDDAHINWGGILREQPAIFSYFMGNSKDYRLLLDFIGRDAEIDTTINVLRANDMLMDSALCWGQLFDSTPAFGSALRRAMVKESDKPVVMRQFPTDIHLFRLDLPAEACLLPHILAAMLDALGPEARLNLQEKAFPSRFRLGAWINGYVPRSTMLKSIWSNNTIDKRTRLAALILHMLHPKAKLNNGTKLILELYDDEDAFWLLPGVGFALFDRIAAGEEDAIECMGTLLERSSKNYFGRAKLDLVLKAWNETPGSPVTVTWQSGLWQ